MPCGSRTCWNLSCFSRRKTSVWHSRISLGCREGLWSGESSHPSWGSQRVVEGRFHTASDPIGMVDTSSSKVGWIGVWSGGVQENQKFQEGSKRPSLPFELGEQETCGNIDDWLDLVSRPCRGAVDHVSVRSASAECWRGINQGSEVATARWLYKQQQINIQSVMRGMSFIPRCKVPAFHRRLRSAGCLLVSPENCSASLTLLNGFDPYPL